MHGVELNIIITISNLDNISLYINPAGTVTEERLKQVLQNIDVSSAISETITLLADNWTQNENTGYYEYNIKDETITENHVINGNVILEDAGKITESDTESYNGGFKVRTSAEVTENVTIDFTILKTTPKEEN